MGLCLIFYDDSMADSCVLLQLFRHFDFMIAYPDKPWNSKCYNVFVESNMWVQVAEAA